MSWSPTFCNMHFIRNHVTSISGIGKDYNRFGWVWVCDILERENIMVEYANSISKKIVLSTEFNNW